MSTYIYSFNAGYPQEGIDAAIHDFTVLAGEANAELLTAFVAQALRWQRIYAEQHSSRAAAYSTAEALSGPTANGHPPSSSAPGAANSASLRATGPRQPAIASTDAAQAIPAPCTTAAAECSAAETAAFGAERGQPQAADVNAPVSEGNGAQEAASGQTGGAVPRLQRTLLLQPIADKASIGTLNSAVRLMRYRARFHHQVSH